MLFITEGVTVGQFSTRVVNISNGYAICRHVQQSNGDRNYSLIKCIFNRIKHYRFFLEKKK